MLTNTKILTDTYTYKVLLGWLAENGIKGASHSERCETYFARIETDKDRDKIVFAEMACDAMECIDLGAPKYLGIAVRLLVMLASSKAEHRYSISVSSPDVITMIQEGLIDKIRT